MVELSTASGLWKDIAVPERASEHAVKPPSRAEAEAAVRTLLLWAGDDPDREGLRDTPARVVKAYEEFFSGYRSHVRDLATHIFTEVHGYNDLVLVRDLVFASHQADNLLPFRGKVHIGYYPGAAGVVGLPKIERLVDVLARRLHTQESFTGLIAATIDKYLQPEGCAVMVEASHLYAQVLGAKREGGGTITTQYTGIFKEAARQMRFFSLVRG